MSRLVRRRRRGSFDASANRPPHLGRDRIDPELLADDSLDVGARKAVTDRLALDARLAGNLRMLTLAAGSSPDIIVRRIKTDASLDAAVLHLQGIVDQERVESVVRTLSSADAARAADLIFELGARLLRSSHVTTVASFTELWDALSGWACCNPGRWPQSRTRLRRQSFKTRPIQEPH